MAEELQATGAEVWLSERIVLRTRGLEGTAERVARRSARQTRTTRGGGDGLGPAFAELDVEVLHEIHLDRVTRTVGVAQAPSTEQGDPAIELDVPDAAKGFGQMVLAVDGAGIATWHFAPEPPADAPVRRGSRMRTYRVRMPSPAPSDGRPVTRGLLGTAAHAVIRVIAFPLVEGLLKRGGKHFVGAWEEQHRPYRLRTFGPDDYRDPHGRELVAEDWRRLGEGRALLFLHGIFSRAHAGFGDLPSNAMAQLDARYGQRLLAFDHPTLSQSPQQNVAWLLAALPADADLQLDVVAHSRGGLVARTLAEQQAPSSLGGLSVERVVLAGTPNAGTALADAAHLGTLVDTYTALLGFVPDVGVTDVLETIVAVAKTIAVGVAQGLDGLGAMQPGGTFLRALNATGAGAGTARYFALSSDYEPPGRAFREWALDHLADALFAKAGNDLVVPTEGVYSANGSPRFPIADRHVFAHADGVAHTSYFASEETARKLLEWLA